MKNNKNYTRMERIRFYLEILDKNVEQTDNKWVEIAFKKLEYLTSERFVDKKDKEEAEEKIKKIAKRKKTA